MLSVSLELAAAYPLLDWSTVILKKRTSESFAAELQQALQVVAGKAAVKFQTSAYERHDVVGWLVEHDLRFLSVCDFERVCGCKPTDIDMPMESLPIGPEGKMVQGVMVRDSDKPGVRLKAFQRMEGLLRTNVFPESREVRPQQAKEIKEWYETDLARTLPKSVSSGPTRLPAMHSFDNIAQKAKEMLQAAKDRAQKAQELQRAEEELLAGPDPAVPEEAVEEKMEENPEEIVTNVIPDTGLVAPSDKVGKKRKRGDQIASPKAGPLATRFKEQLRARTVQGSASSKASQAGNAVMSSDQPHCHQRLGKKPKKSKVETHTDKARDWLKSIDLVELLEGQSGGKDRWGAGQTLQALIKECGGATAESINLKTHIDTAKLAGELGASV